MRTFLILALLCPLLTLSQTNKITPLSIGDTVPDMAMANIINYPTSSANLSSFKGKLLILDFWATWCTSCIKHFPQIDSLQQQYAGRVQLLLVNSKNTGGTKEKVQAFFKKRKINLPSVVEDTVLSALFPHQFLPHYVWISSTGKLLAFTGADELSAANIQYFLAGSAPSLSLKKDIMNYNPSAPLLMAGNGGADSSLLFRTTFTGPLPGMGGGFKKTTTATHKKYTWLNQPILALYWAAARFGANKLVLEVKDSGRFINNQPSFQAWQQGLFSYEITAPISASEERIRSFMWQDLDRYLSLSTRFEIRSIPCWVLVRKGSVGHLKSKGGPPLAQWYTKEQPCNILQNLPLSRLLDVLNLQLMGDPLKPVVINETAYSGPVDMKLSAPLDNLPALKKELQQYGLDLIPTHREIEVFVITENVNPPANETTNSKTTATQKQTTTN